MKKFISVQQWIGLTLMLLGLTVMSGWLLQQAVMVQIRPGHVGMVFNTALSFILTGIALLILNTQYRWRATAQATIGWILISLAALVQIGRAHV